MVNWVKAIYFNLKAQYLSMHMQPKLRYNVIALDNYEQLSIM